MAYRSGPPLQFGFACILSPTFLVVAEAHRPRVNPSCFTSRESSLGVSSFGLPNGFGYGIGPGSDGVPIAEVAFAGASGLHGHSIAAIELAVFQGAVEHGVVTLADLFAELGELERLLLVIFHVGAERANAEEPCGSVG